MSIGSVYGAPYANDGIMPILLRWIDILGTLPSKRWNFELMPKWLKESEEEW